MIGLDTNVVIRYLVQDDRAQAAAATKLLERLSPDNPGLITAVTLCEIVWVLAECYGADHARIESVLEGLLTARQLAVDEAEIVWNALSDWRGSSADFSDALLGRLASARGAERIVTFDRAAAKLPQFELLK